MKILIERLIWIYDINLENNRWKWKVKKEKSEYIFVVFVCEWESSCPHLLEWRWCVWHEILPRINEGKHWRQILNKIFFKKKSHLTVKSTVLTYLLTHLLPSSYFVGPTWPHHFGIHWPRVGGSHLSFPFPFVSSRNLLASYVDAAFPFLSIIADLSFFSPFLLFSPSSTFPPIIISPNTFSINLTNGNKIQFISKLI